MIYIRSAHTQNAGSPKLFDCFHEVCEPQLENNFVLGSEDN